MPLWLGFKIHVIGVMSSQTYEFLRRHTVYSNILRVYIASKFECYSFCLLTLFLVALLDFIIICNSLLADAPEILKRTNILSEYIAISPTLVIFTDYFVLVLYLFVRVSSIMLDIRRESHSYLISDFNGNLPNSSPLYLRILENKDFRLIIPFIWVK